MTLLLDSLAISDLDRLARTSRAMHDMLISDREDSKGIWAQVAARLTAMPERHFYKDRILAWLTSTPMHLVDAVSDPPPKCPRLRIATYRDFFKELRCLMCPWTSTEVYIDLNRPISSPVAMALQDDEQRMVFQTRDGGQMCANTNLLFPSLTHGWASMLFGATDMEGPIDIMNHKDMKHEEDAQRLLGDRMPVKDCSTRGNCTFARYVVSGAVVAITEIYREGQGFYADALNGLYFVSVHDARVLCRRTLPRTMDRTPFLLVSRPAKLWYSVGDTIVHPYPRILANPLFEMRLAHLPSRMCPALWMAADGDVDGAVHYLQQLHCRGPFEGFSPTTHGEARGAVSYINMQSQHDRRTVLHYAAFAGHADACAKLMDMDADPNLTDNNVMDALSVALSALHVDVAEVILARHWGGEVRLATFRQAFNALANPREQEPPITPEDIRARCHDVIPRAVRALMFNLGEVLNSDLSSFRDILFDALRKPIIISSPDAVRIVLNSGGDALIHSLKQAVWIKTIFQVFGRGGGSCSKF